MPRTAQDPREDAEAPLPEAAAFAIVLQTLNLRLREAEGTEAARPIAEAIATLEAADAAIARMFEAQTVPGKTKPGSRAELNEEMAKEKLDP